MSVVVAVTDSPEGLAALAAAGDEAKLLDTDLVVVNVGLRDLDNAIIPSGFPARVVARSGADHHDPFDVVLDEVNRNHTHRLVIGVKRRSRVGKALLGSLSQRLLLEAPVPVLAVKINDDHVED